MSEAGLSGLQQEVFHLYSAGRYREALDLVNRSMGGHPDHLADLCYWQACLAGRLGQRATALRALAEAANAGLFYGKYALGDQDLDSVRGDAEFRRLGALFAERLAAARASAGPDLFTWAPEAGQLPYPLLVALHGNYSRVELEARFWQPAASRGWLVAMPQSSQLEATNRFMWDDQDRARGEVLDHCRVVSERFRVHPGRCVAGGFSKGGLLAIQLAMTGPGPASGFLAVAPAIRPDVLPALVEACSPQVRGYIVIGERDWSYQPARDLVAELRQRGMACELEVHPRLAHEYPEDFARSLERALDFLATA